MCAQLNNSYTVYKLVFILRPQKSKKNRNNIYLLIAQNPSIDEVNTRQTFPDAQQSGVVVGRVSNSVVFDCLSAQSGYMLAVGDAAGIAAV